MSYRWVGALVGLAMLGMAGPAKATNIVPDSLIVTFGGFDWVWASPCSADCSPLVIPLAGGTDWAFPAAYPVLFQPDLSVGTPDPNYFVTNPLWPIYDLFVAPPPAFDFTAAQGACAAGIFDVVHNHCDYVDAVGGRIATDGIVGFNWETWLVRVSNDVPEPSTLALFGIGLAGLGFMTRRRRNRRRQN